MCVCHITSLMNTFKDGLMGIPIGLFGFVSSDWTLSAPTSNTPSSPSPIFLSRQRYHTSVNRRYGSQWIDCLLRRKTPITLSSKALPSDSSCHQQCNKPSYTPTMPLLILTSPQIHTHRILRHQRHARGFRLPGTTPPTSSYKTLTN